MEIFEKTKESYFTVLQSFQDVQEPKEDEETEDKTNEEFIQDLIYLSGIQFEEE